MQVILTEDVVGVGDIGEQVSVKAGYARNFLIPRGFAMEAETASGKTIAHKMRQIEAKKKRMKVDAEESGKTLSALSPKLGLRVGSGGKVFGSISTRDIADALAEKGFQVDRRRILLSEPIRSVGEHQVYVKLHADVKVAITVQVEALAATEEEEAQETETARAKLEASAAEKAEAGQEEQETDAEGELLETDSHEEEAEKESGSAEEAEKE